MLSSSTNVGFNTQFNPTDTVKLILSLMLVVSQQICLKYDLVNTRFQTEVNLRVDLNRNFVFRLSSCLKL